MAKNSSGEKAGFDWGGLFQLVGIGVNAGVSINNANQQVSLAKIQGRTDLMFADVQKRGIVMSSLVELNKSKTQRVAYLFIGLILGLILLLYLFK